MQYGVWATSSLPQVIDVLQLWLWLIDDGILRVDIYPDGYQNMVQQILHVSEGICNIWGLHFSCEKTFPSSKVSSFLHNVKWQNVSPGLRAVLYITNRSDVVILGSLDDLELWSEVHIWQVLCLCPSMDCKYSTPLTHTRSGQYNHQSLMTRCDYSLPRCSSEVNYSHFCHDLAQYRGMC